ncbi:MAG: MerR family transcriptional regulator [Solirubrobacterales bacterium]|nr:MerR family transcriptional regulator [Solirubrobacterales bacterium]
MLNIGEFARLGRVSPRMLRHYDQLGLLAPDRVDPETGYRSYGVQQLGRLHRLLALRDLGFTLEQIRSLLDDELVVEQLRGMLTLRRAELERTVADEQSRLRRVEAQAPSDRWEQHLEAPRRSDQGHPAAASCRGSRGGRRP